MQRSRIFFRPLATSRIHTTEDSIQLVAVGPTDLATQVRVHGWGNDLNHFDGSFLERMPQG